MTAAMMTHRSANCRCVECRIRAACKPRRGEAAEIKAPILALGNVLSELMSHLDRDAALRVSAELMVAREKWLQRPRGAERPARSER